MNPKVREENTYRHEAGSVVYLEEKAIVIPIRHVESRNYSASVTYREIFIDPDNTQKYLNQGRNILSDDEWNKLLSEMGTYFDSDKSSLRIEISKEKSPVDKKENIIQLLIKNPDILVSEDYEYDYEKYDFVATKYDVHQSNLSIRPSSVNIVPEMKHYNNEITLLLNSAMSVLVDDDVIEKYPFLNIEKISPKDAKKRIDGSGRTVFMFSKGLTVRDYI